MTKSLWGRSAVIALLSVSLIFLADTSLAETLALALQEPTQIESIAPAGALGEEMPAAFEAAAAVVAGKTGVPAAGMDKDRRPEEASAPTLHFTATAYSLRGRTASGRGVARGLIAADRRVLPLGTRVRLEAGPYSGEYLVADTGGAVRGRKIDIWVPSTGEAMRFGRRTVKLTVLTRERRPATSGRT